MEFLKHLCFLTSFVLVIVCRIASAQEELPCECVPYYLCEDGKILTDGSDLIDIRSGISSRAGIPTPTCTDPVAKCCTVPPNAVTTTTTTTELPPFNPVTPPPPVRTTTVPPIPSAVITPLAGCGVRRELPTASRVLDGVSTGATHYAEFPWMMMLLIKQQIQENVHYRFKCGGSLVHPQVVVTAAHCVFGVDKETLQVRGGEWDTQQRNEPLLHQDRSIRQILVHQNYNPRNLQNDIAIIIVDSPYNLADNVDIICLPYQTMNFDNARCVASGWGKDSFRPNGTFQSVLRKVDLAVVPHDQCQERLRTTRLGKYYILDESFICAGGEPGRDTCQGDGGSPLICPLPQDPRRWTQVGIVSWGIGCGEDNPAVYTKFSLYTEWIISQISTLMLSDNLSDSDNAATI